MSYHCTDRLELICCPTPTKVLRQVSHWPPDGSIIKSYFCLSCLQQAISIWAYKHLPALSSVGVSLLVGTLGARLRRNLLRNQILWQKQFSFSNMFQLTQTSAWMSRVGLYFSGVVSCDWLVRCNPESSLELLAGRLYLDPSGSVEIYVEWKRVNGLGGEKIRKSQKKKSSQPISCSSPTTTPFRWHLKTFTLKCIVMQNCTMCYGHQPFFDIWYSCLCTNTPTHKKFFFFFRLIFRL